MNYKEKFTLKILPKNVRSKNFFRRGTFVDDYHALIKTLV